jgi:hypothetical protein
MTTLIEMLQQLSELDPATCQRHPDVAVYTIGGYSFWLADDGLFSASIPDCRYVFTARPALAWLRDAVEAACEARGLTYVISTETLLDALIKAIEAAKGERSHRGTM